MEPWVFLFSRFSAEALFFEILILVFLLGLYTAFWVLRKRKYGVIDQSLPSGPVKTYLNDLIEQAEGLRLQLFGLVSANGGIAKNSQLIGVSSEKEAEWNQKLTQLESKVTEQNQSLSQMIQEKTSLERMLEESKAQLAVSMAQAQQALSKSNEPVPVVQTGIVTDLEKKVQELEYKLAEYNVIEDDLVNLKRLQVENANLKAKLQTQRAEIPQPAVAAPVVTPVVEPKAEAPAPEPQASIPAEVEATEPAIPQQDEAALTALAESVDAALPTQTTGASEVADAGAETELPAAPIPNEADLVAEFEKILKG